MIDPTSDESQLQTIATGTITNIQGGICTVRPKGQGPSDTQWPDIFDCQLIHLTGSNNTSGLMTLPKVGDSVLLIFNGNDLSNPVAIPCAVGSNSPSVRLYHQGDSVTLTGSSIVLESASVTVKAPSINLEGNVQATNLSVSGAITNQGKDIGANHTHGNVSNGTGITGTPS